MQHHQYHQNITLSLPSDLVALIHSKVPRRGVSKYVTRAIRMALEKDEEKERLELEAAYEKAAQDSERLSETNEWKSIDDTDATRDWEW